MYSQIYLAPYKFPYLYFFVTFTCCILFSNSDIREWLPEQQKPNIFWFHLSNEKSNANNPAQDRRLLQPILFHFLWECRHKGINVKLCGINTGSLHRRSKSINQFCKPQMVRNPDAERLKVSHQLLWTNF